jgi:hypothetical protein
MTMTRKRTGSNGRGGRSPYSEKCHGEAHPCEVVLRRVCCCVLVLVAANAANLLCPWSMSLSGCGARGVAVPRAVGRLC